MSNHSQSAIHNDHDECVMYYVCALPTYKNIRNFHIQSPLTKDQYEKIKNRLQLKKVKEDFIVIMMPPESTSSVNDVCVQHILFNINSIRFDGVTRFMRIEWQSRFLWKLSPRLNYNDCTLIVMHPHQIN